jgi:Tfp pilus assembly protein PilN
MRGPKTALGIDISNGWINLALIKRTPKGGVKLLKAARGLVPDGAIKDGNVENPAILASAIKKLKAAARIHSQNAAVSLVADPALMQILDIPEDRSSNVRSFVLEEVKHYAMLPMKHAAVDFRGIAVSGKAGGRQVLVAATDERIVAETAAAFARKGLPLKAIEPAWLAYIRACHAKKIAGRFDTNLLFAVVHNDMVTLCLFRNETLDFLRAKRIEPNDSDAGDYFGWLAEEINAIVKFYEFEVSGKSNKWKVILAADDRDGDSDEKVEKLKGQLDMAELEFAHLDDAYACTPITKTNRCGEPSVIAVGLAMKLLDVSACDLGINLLPRSVVEAGAVEKQVLAVANVAAFIFLLMVLAVGFFSMKSEKVNKQIALQKQSLADSDIAALKDKHAALLDECAGVSGKIERLNAAMETAGAVKWARIFSEVSFATPQDVQITGLSSSDGSVMSLQGLARSPQAVHLFVDTLNECERIEAASLVRAEKDGQPDGLVGYSINCSLIP